MMTQYILMAGLAVAGITAAYLKYQPMIVDTFNTVSGALN
jgi:hypothetical protein